MAIVNTDTRTRVGRCPARGDVNAEKTIPTFKFPFVLVFLVRRFLAMFQPYRCPTCGEKTA